MTTTIVVVLIIFFLLIVALCVWLYIRRKRAKAAAAAAGPPPPGAAEINDLIRDAETRLAGAKIGGGKIANLPVFLLVGDPGSTKTSVVTNSGLDPELVAGLTHQNGMVAPTRAANFWLTRNVLFAEAGGALPAEGWTRLVKKLEAKSGVMSAAAQAPRAAMICFDCENFTKPGAQDAAVAAAQSLRAKLAEVSTTLGINVPVYVLFTRMDRLPFFTEFISVLTNDEATQVVGVTLPMSAATGGLYAEEETKRLSEQFERLFLSMADARPDFLGRETDPSKLPASYEFPREFRKIRPAVVQFLVDLCRPSQFAVGPFLRGFYFTGVRPIVINDAAPVAAASASLEDSSADQPVSGATSIFSVGASRQAARMQQPRAMGTSRKVPQWLFLGHLFTDILLADKAALGSSGSSTKTGSARRLLFILATALCLLISLFFTISFFKNRALEADVKSAAQSIAAGGPPAADLAPVDDLRKLEALHQQVDWLGTKERTGAPFFYRLGLYTGSDLYPEARRIYFTRFQQLLLSPAQQAMSGMMAKLPPKPPGPEYNPTYDALKAYLITTSNHDKSTKAFLSPVLMKWWANGRPVDNERTQLARTQFDFYSDYLKDENPFTSANDQLAIARARSYLVQFEGADRVYNFMLSEAAKSNPPINFNKQFPESAKVIVEPVEVPGAFSKNGWGFMKDAIPRADTFFQGEEWVLGKQPNAVQASANLPQDIKVRYNKEFIDKWKSYIRSAAVQKYSGIPDAVTKLSQTASAQSPLLALLCVASENTAVDDPDVTKAFQPVQAVVPAPCASKYIAPPNQNYMQQLANLQLSLQAVAAQPQASELAEGTIIGNATQARGAVMGIAQTFRPDSDLGGSVQKLLEDPITQVEGGVKTMGPAEVNKKGGETCAAFAPVMQKYPFKPTATVEATAQDINTLFNPATGVLWQFWTASLQKIVSRDGKPVPGAKVQVTSNFSYFLSKAAAFTDAAYTGNSPDPKISYTVAPIYGDAERVSLNIDGQTAEFVAPSTVPKTFVWPGPGPTHGLQLAVKLKGTPTPYTFPAYPGLWGVLQFIDNADKRTPWIEMILGTGNPKRPILNQATGQPVKVSLDFSAKPPIFDRGYFSGLSCRPDVAQVK